MAAARILEQLKSGHLTAMLASGDAIVPGALRVLSPDLFDRPFSPLLLAPSRATRARGFPAWFGNGNAIIHIVDIDPRAPEPVADHLPAIDTRLCWQPADFDQLIEAAFPSSEQHERLRRIRIALVTANRSHCDEVATPPIADTVLAICRAMKDAGIAHVGLNGSDDDSWIKQMLRGKYASINTALTKGETALAARNILPPDSRGTI